MFRRLVLGAAIGVLSVAAHAQESALTGSAGIFFSVLSDAQIDDPAITLDADGTATGFVGQIGSDTVFGYIDYQNASRDGSTAGVGFDIDSTETRVGIGVRSADPTLNFIGRLERYDLSLDLAAPGFSNSGDDDGAGVHLGIEAKTSDTASVYGSIGTLQLGDSDGPEYRLGVKALLPQDVELYGEYRMLTLSDDDSDTELELSDIRIGAQFRF